MKCINLYDISYIIDVFYRKAPLAGRISDFNCLCLRRINSELKVLPKSTKNDRPKIGLPKKQFIKSII